MDKYDKLFQDEDDFESPESGEPPRRPGTDLFEWLQLFLGCVVAAVVLFNCVARLTRVDGSSMDNTLQDGEVMLIWSLGYTPKQGDIVVFCKPSFLNDTMVKRVIAVGGQHVKIDYEPGLVYVDGAALEELYVAEAMVDVLYPLETNLDVTVPQGAVFLMGDNRNHSSDSRDERLGPAS